MIYVTVIVSGCSRGSRSRPCGMGGYWGAVPAHRVSCARPGLETAYFIWVLVFYLGVAKLYYSYLDLSIISLSQKVIVQSYIRHGIVPKRVTDIQSQSHRPIIHCCNRGKMHANIAKDIVVHDGVCFGVWPVRPSLCHYHILSLYCLLPLSVILSS